MLPAHGHLAENCLLHVNVTMNQPVNMRIVLRKTLAIIITVSGLYNMSQDI